MTKHLALAACLLLCACVGNRKPAVDPARYDFGLAPAGQAVILPVKLSLADIDAPSWLSGRSIRYRLEYKETGRVYAYANSQWAAPPGELLARRLEQSVAGIGHRESRVRAGCRLHIELEAFEQVFTSPGESHGLARLRASLANRATHAALAQQAFSARVDAASADAQGGVAALSTAADTSVRELADWLKKAFDPSQPQGAMFLQQCGSANQ